MAAQERITGLMQNARNVVNEAVDKVRLNERLRSVRAAYRAIPRKDPGSNPGGDRPNLLA